MKVILVILTTAFFLNCKKADVEDQITIKINSIDKETKRIRVNKFDTVIIKKEGKGYLMKTFNAIGKYATDSTGAVTVKIDPSKIYDISITGIEVLGGEIIYPENFKSDQQELDIEVIHLNKSKNKL